MSVNYKFKNHDFSVYQIREKDQEKIPVCNFLVRCTGIEKNEKINNIKNDFCIFEFSKESERQQVRLSSQKKITEHDIVKNCDTTYIIYNMRLFRIYIAQQIEECKRKGKYKKRFSNADISFAKKFLKGINILEKEEKIADNIENYRYKKHIGYIGKDENEDCYFLYFENTRKEVIALDRKQGVKDSYYPNRSVYIGLKALDVIHLYVKAGKSSTTRTVSIPAKCFADGDVYKNKSKSLRLFVLNIERFKQFIEQNEEQEDITEVVENIEPENIPTENIQDTNVDENKSYNNGLKYFLAREQNRAYVFFQSGQPIQSYGQYNQPIQSYGQPNQFIQLNGQSRQPRGNLDNLGNQMSNEDSICEQLMQPYGQPNQHQQYNQFEQPANQSDKKTETESIDAIKITDPEKFAQAVEELRKKKNTK